MKITLIGYMGSGKSTIGEILAQKMNLEFIDLDNLLENIHGMSVSQIFKSFGEIKFRKSERENLIKILNEKDNFVLALGGGTPVYYDNIKLINENTFSFYLRHSIGALTERLTDEKESRPLLAHLNDEEIPEFLAKHLFERRDFYEQAQFSINAGNKTPNETAEEIMSLLPR